MNQRYSSAIATWLIRRLKSTGTSMQADLEAAPILTVRRQHRLRRSAAAQPNTPKENMMIPVTINDQFGTTNSDWNRCSPSPLIWVHDPRVIKVAPVACVKRIMNMKYRAMIPGMNSF